MNFLHLKNGLREIADNYKIFSIDLWGVVHDGVSLNPRAMEVLDNLKKNNKKFDIKYFKKHKKRKHLFFVFR